MDKKMVIFLCLIIGIIFLVACNVAKTGRPIEKTSPSPACKCDEYLKDGKCVRNYLEYRCPIFSQKGDYCCKECEKDCKLLLNPSTRISKWTCVAFTDGTCLPDTANKDEPVTCGKYKCVVLENYEIYDYICEGQGADTCETMTLPGDWDGPTICDWKCVVQSGET